MTDRDPSVTFLTEYFHPEEASTAQLMTELTTGLSDRFDVSVLTARPNYHEDDRERSVDRTTEIDGVRVSRLRSTRFDKDSLPRRVINWVTFTTLAWGSLLRDHRDADAVLALSNPPILPLAAWLHKRITGTPYVYLVYDMYPDMAVELDYVSAGNPITRIWAWVMRRIYRDADRIVVLGESMRRRLVEKMADDEAFDPEKIVVIPNWEDEAFIEPMDKEDNDFAESHDTVDRFTLVYSGNVGRFHDLETAIDAIGRLEERGRTDVQLLIIGDGARKRDLREYVDERGIDNVRFLPFQPLDRLPETLTCGDASLVGIEPGMVGMCVSSKLYSSLAAGMPVLAVVGSGDEVARVVEENDCGEHVLPGEAEAVADVLESWADDSAAVARMGRNARRTLERRYTLRTAVEDYGRLFDDLIAQ